MQADPDGVGVGHREHRGPGPRGDAVYVTAIIDLTGARDGTGTARLLDMVEGPCKAVFKTWLPARTNAWRDGIEIVATDGYPPPRAPHSCGGRDPARA